MVDAARVTALLFRIRNEVAQLRRAAERTDEELLAAEDALPAMKYRPVVAIEAATDVADHVIASEGYRPATSFADSFRSLAEARMLDTDGGAGLQDAGSAISSCTSTPMSTTAACSRSCARGWATSIGT